MSDGSSQEQHLRHKGRGAQKETANRFLSHSYVDEDTGEIAAERRPLRLLPTHPKSILNRIQSPDVPAAWGLNPYQGCEHGCSYCYARPTHEYWGFGAGLDFEQTILYKPEAAALLRSSFEKATWKPEPVLMSGNTDCYQPIERRLGLSRSLLEVFVEYRNPLRIITKNALITRDIDLLQDLASHQLLEISISITTLDEALRSKLEPRTSTIERRFEAVRALREAGIRVSVLMAPLIPGLTDREIFPLAKRASEAGANHLSYSVLRLGKGVFEIFEDWLKQSAPERYSKVFNSLRSMHGGQNSSSEYGKRMSGRGAFAESLRQQFALAKRKYGFDSERVSLRTDLFRRKMHGQMSLDF
jgi:DNA repair photolyase